MSDDLIICRVIGTLGRRGTTGEVQMVKVREQKENAATSIIPMYGSVNKDDIIVIKADRIRFLGG